MGKILGRITGLLLLAAFAYAGFNAWMALVPPKRPIMDFSKLDPACEEVGQTSNAHVGGALECHFRLNEARRLKAHPGVAVRDGDNLTIFYRGKQSARLIPVPDSETEYDAMDVRKVLSLHDPVTQKPEAVPVIAGYSGEFESRFLALPNDTRWNVRDASASPDGKLVVEGDNRIRVERSTTTLYSWPERKSIAHFNVGCRVLTWRDSGHFMVTCTRKLEDIRTSPDVPFADYLGPPLAFDARVWRDRDGRWQMQATRWLGTGYEFSPDGDVEIPPTFSLYWLPHYTAVAG